MSENKNRDSSDGSGNASSEIGTAKKKSFDANQPNGKKSKKKKQWSKKKKALMIVLAVLLVFALLIGVLVMVVFSFIGKINTVQDPSSIEILDSIDISDDLTSEPDSPQEDIDDLEAKVRENLKNKATELKSDDDVYNILLIGTDARSVNERGRSDSMILVSINDKTKEVVMTSFMRDIYLQIPGAESTRLNHAYAYGGAPLLVDTIEQNFSIDIDKYAQVNFFSFVDVVDAVDGVEMNVSDAEAKLINSYLKEINKLHGYSASDSTLSSGGTYTLNGRQALAYSRIRYVGNGDFERTQRQRDVLEKVLQKMTDLSMTELNDLLNILLPEITTNLTEGEIFSLMLNSSKYLGYDRVQCRVPEDGTWSYLTVRGMSVLGVDFDANKKYLLSNIYGE